MAQTELRALQVQQVPMVLPDLQDRVAALRVLPAIPVRQVPRVRQELMVPPALPAQQVPMVQTVRQVLQVTPEPQGQV